MSAIQSMEGKSLIVINAGGELEWFILEGLCKIGIKPIVVNKDNNFPKRLAEHVVIADPYSYRDVVEKLQIFKDEKPGVKFDGAVCFYEDNIPVLARVVEHFGLIGNSYKTAINTRNKYEMRKRFRETGLGSPDFALVKTKRDLTKAINSVGFPAVMKPSWGCDSEFVVLVKDEDEAYATLEYLQKNANESYTPIHQYNQGNFLYEEYVPGLEISLEAYAQYGIPNVIALNEKAPPTPPYFVESGDFVPARLTDEERDNAIKLGESALIALGVKNSIAHIEMKLTPQGPKIIEVASRMGGDDIHFYVKDVWGIDLIRVAAQVALGIQVDVKRKREPKEYLITKYFIPPATGIITNISGLSAVKKMKNVARIVVTHGIGDTVLVPPEGFETMGWVVARGRSYQEAQTQIDAVFRELEISVTKFSKDSSLGRTNKKEALVRASMVRGQVLRAAKIGKIRTVAPDALNRLNIGIITNSEVPQLDESMRPSEVGKEVRKVLKSLGYKVSLFDMSENPLPIAKLMKGNLDFVFNLCEALHNLTYLESHAAALLDVLQIPYSGSGPSTMSLCADKITVKKLFAFHEIPTPDWDYAYSMDDEIRKDLRFPLIVKPANTDNSYGITNESIVTNEKELQRQLEVVIQGYKRPALVEEYIEGDEYDICILGNDENIRVLPIIRSVFDAMPPGFWHIYGSDAKFETHDSPYNKIKVEKRPKISDKLRTLLSEISVDAYTLFGLQDYGKVEIRVDKLGNPYVLEVNPNPPIEKDYLYAVSAEAGGMNYENLIEELIYMAVKRYRDMDFNQVIA